MSNEVLDTGLVGASHRQAVDVFRATPDGAARDHILNTQVVQLVDGVIATNSTTIALRGLISDQERRGEGGYMPQPIGALSAENLVGVANAMVIEVEKPEVELRRQVSESAGITGLQSALADIQQTAESTDVKTVAEQPKEGDILEDYVMQELAERLVDDKADPAELIAAIEDGLTPQLFDNIVKNHPEVLAGLVRHAGSFSNQELRNVLIRRAIKNR